MMHFHFIKSLTLYAVKNVILDTLQSDPIGKLADVVALK